VKLSAGEYCPTLIWFNWIVRRKCPSRARFVDHCFDYKHKPIETFTDLLSSAHFQLAVPAATAGLVPRVQPLLQPFARACRFRTLILHLRKVIGRAT